MSPEKLGYGVVPFWEAVLNLPAMVKNPIPVLKGFFEKYGDSYLMKRGDSLFIFTQNPLLIKHVLQKNHRNYKKSEMQTGRLTRFIGHGLLTSEGDYWRQQRRLIQPSFGREKIRALAGVMKDEACTFFDEFDQENKNQVDVNHMMMNLTFSIVAKALFGTGISAETILELRKGVEAGENLVIKLLRAPFLEKFFKLSGRFKKTFELIKVTDDVLMGIIEKRKAESDQSYNDLLDAFLSARYEDTGEGMSNKQLLDESKIMFVAGHETSANAISWTLYLLSQHAEIFEKVKVSIHDKESTYLRQVIQESMRLYPPAWLTDREAIEDDEFEGKLIPKGAVVMTYIYGAQQNASFWDRSQVFDPDRFEESSHGDQYFPFGAGPRMCIGNHFAMMEMEIILKEFISRYDFKLSKKARIALNPVITLNPKHGVLMDLARLS
ncbi:MAG: cytochrome P450 [Cyclobacteriaceae bacterium]